MAGHVDEWWASHESPRDAPVARNDNARGPRISVAEAKLFFGSLRVSVIRQLSTPRDGRDFA